MSIDNQIDAAYFDRRLPKAVEITDLPEVDGPRVRTFETGAIRNVDVNRPDYEGFLSPLALEAFGAYMNHHRQTPAGLRDSDNWQKGIPFNAYIKSGWRHFFDWWRAHRGLSTHEGMVFALLGLWFNLQGYLHEYLKAHPEALAEAIAAAQRRREAKNDPFYNPRTGHRAGDAPGSGLG